MLPTQVDIGLDLPDGDGTGWDYRKRPVRDKVWFLGEVEQRWGGRSGAGPYGHMIDPGTSSGGDTIVAPVGAYLNLSAYTSEEAPGDPGTSTAGANTRRAEGFNYTFKDAACTTYSGTPKFYLKHVADIQPFFTANAPHGYLTHIAISDDGGDAFIDAIANAINLVGYDGGLYETVRTLKPGPDDNNEYPLRVSCKPEPGYQVVAWNGAFAGPAYLGTSAGTYDKNSGSKGGGAENQKKDVLMPRILVDGGGGTPAEGGHIIAYPAQKYYSIFNTTLVELDVSTNTCFAFQRWSGDGVAYPANVLTGQPNLGNPLALDDPDNPVTDSTIWVMMGLGVDRTVTAHVGEKATVVGFANVAEVQDPVLGSLYSTYTWASSSGNEEDLQGQTIVEILAYDPSIDTEAMLEFVETGLERSFETIWFPNEIVPVIRRWGWTDGWRLTAGDHNGRMAIPIDCGTSCSWTIRQWFIVLGHCEPYIVGGPFEIIMSYHQEDDNWQYCITKHDGPYCIDPEIP